MSKNILTYYIVVCLLNISCGSNEENKQTDPNQEKDESSENIIIVDIEVIQLKVILLKQEILVVELLFMIL